MANQADKSLNPYRTDRRRSRWVILSIPAILLLATIATLSQQTEPRKIQLRDWRRQTTLAKRDARPAIKTEQISSEIPIDQMYRQARNGLF